MMQLALRTPPAFHVQPFDPEPAPAKHTPSVLYVAIAVLVAAFLNVALVAGSARRSAGNGMVPALSAWVADLDNPQL
jgi:hypothetical protein